MARRPGPARSRRRWVTIRAPAAPRQESTIPADEHTLPNVPAAPTGLTESEAARRRAAGGGNDVPAATGRTYRQIIRDNVFNFINNLLFVLAAVLIAVGHYLDALLSVGVVLANTVISLFQEVRAKRTLDRIAILTRPHAVVVRDGRERDATRPSSSSATPSGHSRATRSWSTAGWSGRAISRSTSRC